MRFRKLRIAFSAVCGIVFVMTIVLWLKILPSWNVYARGGDGRMIVRLEHRPIVKWFRWRSDPITFPTPPDAPNRMPWFDVDFWPTFARLYTAHWFLAVLAGSFTILPWTPRRFTLRGLLIAVTVVATMTAILVWVDKTF